MTSAELSVCLSALWTADKILVYAAAHSTLQSGLDTVHAALQYKGLQSVVYTEDGRYSMDSESTARFDRTIEHRIALYLTRL